MLTTPEFSSDEELARTVEGEDTQPFEPMLTLADVRRTRRAFFVICGALILVSLLIGLCLVMLSVLISNPGSESFASEFVGGAATLFEAMETQGWAALGAISVVAIPIALVVREISEKKHPDAATYVGGDILQGAAAILGVASVVSAFAIATSGGTRWFALTNIVAVLVALILVGLAAFAKLSLSNWELQAVAVAAEMRREEHSRLVEVKARRERSIRPLPWRWREVTVIVVVLVLIGFTCGMAVGDFTLPVADIIGLLAISLLLVASISVYAVFVSAQLQVAWDRRNIADLIIYGAIALLVFLSLVFLVLGNCGDPLAGVLAANLGATLILVAFDRRTRGPATAYASRVLNRRIGRLAEGG
ncbi:hypothetical protein [Prescottella agglutinans]|uniref:hypothetical protein n=1 Tax=Prescottella agglutinans TaxID=1644129 RepID=UPI003D985E46